MARMLQNAAAVAGIGLSVVIVGAILFGFRRPIMVVPPPPEISPILFPVRILVDPTIVDNDSATFQVNYVNQSNTRVRFDAVFEVFDPQNEMRIEQDQTIEIEPQGEVIVFWNTGDLLSLSNMPGRWKASFNAFDRFTREFLAQEVEIFIPVSL